MLSARLFLRLLPLAAAVLAGPALRAQADDPVFIAHRDVQTAAFTRDEARAVLLGTQTNWPGGGGALKLAVLVSGPVHEKVMADIVGRTPTQFESHWKRLVFTGGGVMPQQCRNDAELVAYVASTPGAFGYVAPAAVTDQVRRVDVRP